ncbi:MAG: ElyC/SanA/YdcF family protein [Bacteroidota bacterium]
MLRSLVSLILNPLYFFYLLLLLGGSLYFFRYYKTARICWGLAIAWLLVVSISPLPVYLAQNRESRYAVLTPETIKLPSNEPVHVLVLGAGHSNSPGYTVYDRLSETALKRLLEGVRCYQELPNCRLVCSGYSSVGYTSQAETLASAALLLGVSSQDTLLQPTAQDTEMEARVYSERFSDHHPLILVTSALHMPRALFWFRHYGLDPIPAPTNHLVMPDPGYEPFAWKPSLRKIEMTQKLLHEYAGMLYAQFKVGNGK